MPRPTEPVKRVCYADDITVSDFRSPDTCTRTADQQLPGRDVYVSEGQLFADIGPKVNSHSLHARPFPSQVSPKDCHC